MTHTHYHHHTGQLVQEGNNVANWLKGRIESDSGGKISRITSTHTHTNNPKTQQRHTNSQWPNNTNEHTWSLVRTHVTQPHRDTLNTETSIYFHVPVYLAWFTQTSLSFCKLLQFYWHCSSLLFNKQGWWKFTESRPEAVLVCRDLVTDSMQRWHCKIYQDGDRCARTTPQKCCTEINDLMAIKWLMARSVCQSNLICYDCNTLSWLLCMSVIKCP